MNRRLKVGVLGVGLLLGLSTFAPSAKAADYTVKADDSLFKIGVVFDTTVEELQSLNNLVTDEIYEGQLLDVPANHYSIESGDSLYSIAEEHNLSIATLRIANDKWDNIIYADRNIVVPEGEGEERLRNLLYPSYYDKTEEVEPDLYLSEAMTLEAPIATTIPSNARSATSNSSVRTNTSSTSSTVVSNSSSVISYTQAELDLLARLITAEATGQPYEAMVSVGAVVVNRVQNKEWPSSIHSVIHQVVEGHYQFTPVKNGMINKPASSLALKAAKEALTGVDKSNGSVYFFDDSSTSSWLWSRDIMVRYDRMIFAR